jgi:Zn-dependent membrane protease YugP
VTQGKVIAPEGTLKDHFDPWKRVIMCQTQTEGCE